MKVTIVPGPRNEELIERVRRMLKCDEQNALDEYLELISHKNTPEASAWRESPDYDSGQMQLPHLWEALSKISSEARLPHKVPLYDGKAVWLLQFQPGTANPATASSQWYHKGHGYNAARQEESDVLPYPPWFLPRY